MNDEPEDRFYAEAEPEDGLYAEAELGTDLKAKSVQNQICSDPDCKVYRLRL